MRDYFGSFNTNAWHSKKQINLVKLLGTLFLSSNRVAFNPSTANPMSRRTARYGVPLAATVEEDLASRAGVAAAEAAANVATRSAEAVEIKRGRPVQVTLRAKPLGIIVATNPSGRGCFISEVVPGSVAAIDGRLQEGDFVTDVVGPDGNLFHVSWLQFEDVREAIERTATPLKVKVRRGGPEPWSLERDDSGLSVEEMLSAAKSQYGRLMDDADENALRNAFAEIKEGERRDASRAAAEGGYESDSLKAVSALEFELRSFAIGARSALERVAQQIFNRALLDSKLAVSTAEYFLRRAIFDTTRILSSGSAAVAALIGSSSANADTRASSAPFQNMLGSISQTRALARASDDEKEAIKMDAETQKAQEDAATAAEAERQEKFRQEATELLREAIRGVEIWAKDASDADKKAARKAPIQSANASRNEDTSDISKGDTFEDEAEPVDWELLRQRASLLGGEAAQSVGQALEVVQADFEAYRQLRQQGQLPTIAEQLGEPLENLKGPSGGSTLSSFRDQKTPMKQRAKRQQRRESERNVKNLKVTAAIGQRASKDTADAFVFGVLPPAKVVGRMVAKRIADSVATSFDLDQQKKNDRSSANSKGAFGEESLAGFVGQIAQDIAQEYATDIKRGQDLGLLADVAEAVKGPTTRLQEDLKAVGTALEAAVSSTRADVEAKKVEMNQLKTGVEVTVVASTEILVSPDEPIATSSEVRSSTSSQVEVEMATLADEQDVLNVDVVTSDEFDIYRSQDRDGKNSFDDRPNSVVETSSSLARSVEEAEAIEVDVVTSEADPEQQNTERNAQLVDSALLTFEVIFGTLSSRTIDLLTPEGARPWMQLSSLRRKGSVVDQKAARAREARERALDNFASSIERK